MMAERSAIDNCDIFLPFDDGISNGITNRNEIESHSSLHHYGSKLSRQDIPLNDLHVWKIFEKNQIN